LIGAGVGFLVALGATPLFAVLARRLGLLDRPEGRKDHGAPTPLLGGAGLFAGLAAGVAWPGSLDGGGVALLEGTGIAFAVGLLDDSAKRRFPAWGKLAGQCTAAAAALASGLRTPRFSPEPLDLALAGLFLVGATNAWNFLDNMNGLAAGLGAAAAGTLLLLGETASAGPLLGACLGFLPWNFPRARVFAGDAGSHAVGFAVAAAALGACARAEGSLPERALPLLALAVPLLDLVRVVLLRLRLRRLPHVGDHLHLSHRVAAAGLGRVRAVLLLWGLAAACGGAALAASGRGARAARIAEGGALAAFAALARWGARPYQRTTVADS
jgi:UDP-GlcNAc:undecaprenyl-phosphate GlcNAc-1-phosphate transferase